MKDYELKVEQNREWNTKYIKEFEDWINSKNLLVSKY